MRWLAAGSLEAMVRDLRRLLRLAEGRAAQPTAVIFDRRTLQSSPESGGRAGYDGYKRRRGSKLHMAAERGGLGTADAGRPGDSAAPFGTDYLPVFGRSCTALLDCCCASGLLSGMVR
jgi:hypothetical protein